MVWIALGSLFPDLKVNRLLISNSYRFDSGYRDQADGPNYDIRTWPLNIIF